MKIKYIMYNVQDYAVLHDTVCSVTCRGWHFIHK